MYQTNGADEGFTPTWTWSVAMKEQRRLELQRRPGTLSLRFTEAGSVWEIVDVNGDLRTLTEADAQAELRARSLR